MNRREFIATIAAIAACGSSRPETLLALTKYYEINTPATEPLLCFDELLLGGLAARSSPLRFTIFDGELPILLMGFNAFGGVLRWVAAPDQKVMMPVRNARWKIESDEVLDDDWVKAFISGQVSYIGQDGVRVRRSIDSLEASFITADGHA